jgi:hypothetical protein
MGIWGSNLAKEAVQRQARMTQRDKDKDKDKAAAPAERGNADGWMADDLICGLTGLGRPCSP